MKLAEVKKLPLRGKADYVLGEIFGYSFMACWIVAIIKNNETLWRLGWLLLVFGILSHLSAYGTKEKE